MHRRALQLLLLAVASYSISAAAQTYPARAVRVIIPAAPADSCDVLSRLVAPKVSERLGQQLVIDNRPGAGGQLGLQLLTQAPPDGYTIACGQGGNMVIVPLAYQKVAYDTMRDFAPVALVASNFLGLVVHPTVPFRNAGELISYAKSNPGKLTFGSTGEDAFLHSLHSASKCTPNRPNISATSYAATSRSGESSRATSASSPASALDELALSAPGRG